MLAEAVANATSPAFTVLLQERLRKLRWCYRTYTDWIEQDIEEEEYLISSYSKDLTELSAALKAYGTTC